MANHKLSRVKRQHQDAYRRQREANDRIAEDARNRAAEIAEKMRIDDARLRVEQTWGTNLEALMRLGSIGKQLDQLHAAERLLLAERDQLVSTLRELGVSWALLTTRSGLSRQALSKRHESR